MANQPESATYDAGVYQIQTTDPVQGGLGGVSNTPLLNLANRTAYLKAHIDAIESGAFIPPTVAPINSPIFTGTPSGPTPAAGDSSTKFATTAFVQNLNGGIASVSGLTNANVTLTAAQYGCGIINLTGTLTGNINIVFPTTGKWIVANNTSGNFSITCKTAAGTGVVVTQGKSNILSGDGTNIDQSFTDFNNVALTGTATAPTVAAGDNSTNIATTAFAQKTVINANKIINGDMAIDQRNGGSSVSLTNVVVYTIDRWYGGSASMTTQTFSAQQVASTLSGCAYSLKGTIGGTGAAPAAGAYVYLSQIVEGVNCADLKWGTASAKPVTISFRAKYSVSGTYAVAVRNSATNRTYIASFAVTGGVDTPVTLTIPGDTSGTWLTNTGIGLWLSFDLGVGTTNSTTAGSWQAGNFFGLTGGTKLCATTGATFEVSQVKIETGSVQTPFVSDDFAVSMSKCLRYCYVWNTQGLALAMVGPMWGNTVGQAQSIMYFPQAMRAPPSLATRGTFQFANFYNGAGGTLTTGITVSTDIQCSNTVGSLTTSPVSTSGVGELMAGNDSTARMIWSAEL